MHAMAPVESSHSPNAPHCVAHAGMHVPIAPWSWKPAAHAPQFGPVYSVSHVHAVAPFTTAHVPWPLHVPAMQVVSSMQAPLSRCVPASHDVPVGSPHAASVTPRHRTSPRIARTISDVRSPVRAKRATRRSAR